LPDFSPVNVRLFSQAEPLAEEHLLERFSSGDESLDSWLIRYAHHAKSARTATTYVVTCGDDSNEVVGYHALAASAISPVALTERLRKGAGQHKTPAILIARLAVTQDHQGKGLGSWLLRDALLRIHGAAEQIGCRVALVSAVNGNAEAFYRANGFSPSLENRSVLAMLVSDFDRLLDS
jgi:GNAT superfamily N-acetyltransferase